MSTQNLVPDFDTSDLIDTNRATFSGDPLEDNQNKKQSRFRILKQEILGRCTTFELLEEDHTLGNALRHMILKNPNVKFCGYAIPHPNERKVNFQIQVYKGEALDALEQGLKDLLDLNKIVRQKIEAAYESFGPVELVDSEEEDEKFLEKLKQAKINKAQEQESSN